MICAPGYTMVAGQCVARVEPQPVPAAHVSDLGLWLGCLVLVAVGAVAVIAWWRSG